MSNERSILARVNTRREYNKSEIKNSVTMMARWRGPWSWASDSLGSAEGETVVASPPMMRCDGDGVAMVRGVHATLPDR